MSPPSLSLASSAEPRYWGNLQPHCQAPPPPPSSLGHSPSRALSSCSLARPPPISVAPPPASMATPPFSGSSLNSFTNWSSGPPSAPSHKPSLHWLLPLFLWPLFLLVVLSPNPLCPPSLLLQFLPPPVCPCPPTHSYPVPTPSFLNLLPSTSWWSFPLFPCPIPSPQRLLPPSI